MNSDSTTSVVCEIEGMGRVNPGMRPEGCGGREEVVRYLLMPVTGFIRLWPALWFCVVGCCQW